MNSGRRWSFFRAGGFDQVRIRSGEDIARLGELDQKLWGALSCPTKGLEFDARTLEMIDTDKDGRIRAPEIIAAAKWVTGLLKDPDVLLKPKEPLRLEFINDGVPEGERLLASARQILSNLGKPDAGELTVADVSDAAKLFANTRFNGDGVITAESAADAALASIITDIINCAGGDADRSGRPGVSQAKIDAFFASLEQHNAWKAALVADPARLQPLGESTAGAWEAVKAIKPKLDDFFARCRMARFDGRAEAALNRQQEEYLAIAAKDLTIEADEIAAFPLSHVAACASLPFDDRVNPAWAAEVKALAEKVARPLLGELQGLTHEQWLEIQARLAPFAAWLASRPAGYADKLGEARAAAILAGDARAKLAELVAQDKAVAPHVEVVSEVVRLVYYKRYFYQLLCNYVNFSEFYARGEMAIFQAGVLYLDQRSCELCVRVEDVARHASLAPLSRSYLAYCDCTRRGGAEKMTIAAAFTAGDSDNLMVGRNGLFYDRKGNDWDATITKIVDMPISIRQAFWAPYKRAIRYIEEQIAKRAAAADAAATTGLTTGISQATTAPAAGAPGAAAQPKKLDVGVVAALGVALGALTTAFATLLSWLAGTSFIYVPLYVALLMLLISLPSMLIAALKLRQRNLGPLLDANGWAVNTRAKINIPFGEYLTRRATLPPGSYRDLLDPYAESRAGRTWTLVIVGVVVAVLAAWYFGVVEKYLPGVTPKSPVVKAREQAATQPAATQPAATPAP
jgi:hypothetical protein